MEKKVILTAKDMEITVWRLVHQLIENHRNFENTALIALQPRGQYLGERLQRLILQSIEATELRLGFLDATFFRDDFRRRERFLVPKKTDMPFLVENMRVVFIDDVVYKGRSVRAALSAIQSFGRPSTIELLTLIDRRFSRDLPIQPDYRGCAVDASDAEDVRVSWVEDGGVDEVCIEG